MRLVRCPEHDGMVPLVNPRGWQGAPTLVGRLEIARHATGPLVEIAPGYWRRLPCWGSHKVLAWLDRSTADAP